MAVRKTRTDAWEAKLADETRAKLYALTGHLSYHAAAAVAWDELKVVLPPQGTFYRFLARMREEDAALRLAKASAVSRELGLLSEKAGVDDHELVKSFQALGAEAALSGDLENAAHFMKMMALVASKSQKERELTLNREKFEFDAAKKAMEEAAKIKSVAADDTLDDDEKISKVREALFGA